MSDLHPLPRGFQAAGGTCGIKVSGKKDLALFVSDRPCAAGGVFTQNLVVGAPVTVCRERVPSSTARGVIINSGNANACTGQQGIDDARWMTSLVSETIHCRPEDVLVCSTGVIGRLLPRDVLARGIPIVASQLRPDRDAFRDAAEAMITTDTICKQSSRIVSIGSTNVVISAAAKGAAMIAPNMATMLAVVLTDAALTNVQAQNWLHDAVQESFNCISVDGHTSTSDTVLLLANGASNMAVQSVDEGQRFRIALREICQELAQCIIRDAEGADHFVTIRVSGLRNAEDANCVARHVADSALVKTAIAGNDPNWGRIVSAAGYAGVPFDSVQTSLKLNGFLLYEHGLPTKFDEVAVSQALKTGEVDIDLRFGDGPGQARFWTCDLTQEYVRLNSEYTT